jgi:hypothetical protein
MKKSLYNEMTALLTDYETTNKGLIESVQPDEKRNYADEFYDLLCAIQNDEDARDRDSDE